MQYRKKLIFLVAIILVVVTVQWLLPAKPLLVKLYGQYIFLPYQTFRNILFENIPVSIGDLLYLAGGLLLLLIVVQWFRFLFRFQRFRHRLAYSLIHTGTAIGVLYLLFFIGWGGNYYKPSLSKYWKLETPSAETGNFLFTLDDYFITQLNTLAPAYRDLTFREVDKRAGQYFNTYIDNRAAKHGVGAKGSIFEQLLPYFGIQGYYNPFTGEAQINTRQPGFMLPFVVCHEMAHQVGIAAEDDANLLAYALGTTVPDTTFRYSAYFNLWLYTHSRVRALDSVRAREHRSRLNQLSLAHMDTLRTIRQRYRSNAGVYSGRLFDRYLRIHNQHEGIRSYNNVVETAWLLEQQRKHEPHKRIVIP